jgi:hypothetical protein
VNKEDFQIGDIVLVRRITTRGGLAVGGEIGMVVALPEPLELKPPHSRSRPAGLYVVAINDVLRGIAGELLTLYQRAPTHEEGIARAASALRKTADEERRNWTDRRPPGH